MIVRGYIKCLTCNHPHMPRVQVGMEPTQSHTFKCQNCNEPIRLCLEINPETLGSKIIPLENCDVISPTECTSIYLCGDFVADPSQIHQEMSFPSFNFIMDTLKNKNIDELARVAAKREMPKSHLQIWNELKKIWRLENAGKHKVSEKLISQFAQDHETSEKELPNILWQFLQSIFPIGKEVREEIRQIIRLNKPEFIRFLMFYKLELKANHRRSQFDILQEYYDAYDQHSQVFPYVRMSKPFSEIGKATLIDFDKVKSFYANVYEFFAGGIAVYTCLNNIKNKRPYDQLKKISLKNYLETDKAKRRDSLHDNDLFLSLTKEFDSKIRNASFHNWFFLLPDNETIELRSGGTGAIHKITYTEYLYHCGVLFKQICLLMILELELEQISKELNVYTFNTI